MLDRALPPTWRKSPYELFSNMRFHVQRARSATSTCEHVDQIRDVEPNAEGCEQCLALGDGWVHLRMCMTCGLVGCCDSSKNKHASRHAREVGHPIARSQEPGEYWMWCFVDQALVEP
jgi:uncharacterized UBP type Zn finger protein